MMNDNFATKADVERIELKLDTKLAEVRIGTAGLETRIAEKFDQLKTEFTDRAFDTIKWTAGMQVGTVLAIIAAIKLL